MVGLLRFHVQVNIFAVPVPTAGLGHFVWETDTSDSRYSSLKSDETEESRSIQERARQDFTGFAR